MPPNAGQRVVLITGSTSGLGREVARSLAGSGDHVIVHGRSVERGSALVDELNRETSGSARFYRADFASLHDVRSLAEAIATDYARLDVLVNNAGILPGRERRESQDGNELALQVNYLAGYLLTDLLLPLLKESAPSRIVNVSSRSAAPLDFDNLMLESGYSSGRAYGQSKLAQVMHVMDLAGALAGTGVTANALHPAGAMDTNMIRSAGMRPRTSVVVGRDRVLQLINEPDAGTGLFYRNGEPAQPRHRQPYNEEARASLRRESDRLVRSFVP